MRSLIFYCNSSDQIEIHTGVCFCYPWDPLFLLYMQLPASKQPFPTRIIKANQHNRSDSKHTTQCEL